MYTVRLTKNWNYDGKVIPKTVACHVEQKFSSCTSSVSTIDGVICKFKLHILQYMTNEVISIRHTYSYILQKQDSLYNACKIIKNI